MKNKIILILFTIIFSWGFDLSGLDSEEEIGRPVKETTRFAASFIISYIIKNLANLELNKNNKTEKKMLIYACSLIGILSDIFFLTNIDNENNNDNYSHKLKLSLTTFASMLGLLMPAIK